MARWLAKLDADAEDLDDFTRWFPRGEVFAEANADGVFLVGSGLDVHEDVGQVKAVAEQALDEFFGVISLLSKATKRPRLGGIFHEDDEGVRREHIFLTSSIFVRLRGHVRGGGTGPTQAQLLLAGSKTNASLGNALQLWSDPNRTWPRLYRILEEIETYVGVRVHKAHMCTAAQRERFTRSANVAEVAGKDARHAAGKFEPPAVPMTVREATSFISSLLQAALRKAAGY